MDSELAKEYYLRKEIQKAILSFARNREIGLRFNGFFGKRPDILENSFDIKKAVEKGVLSFHMSEQIWLNPLILGNDKLSEEEQAKNRLGWDLILDLDGLDFDISKETSIIIIEFLKGLGIKNISIKFSGNKGFHIGIPFEAFPKNIIGIGETKDLFPDAARKITDYISFEIREKVSKSIIKKFKSIENVSKKFDIPLEDLIIDDKKSLNLDYMKIIEIDSILISNRHLFRMPYSLNEKSELVSIPINPEKISEFEREEAKPENTKPEKYKEFEFLKFNSEFGQDAGVLLMKAFEDDKEREEEREKRIKRFEHIKKGTRKGIILEYSKGKEEFFDITENVEISEFPKTINYILENKFSDGKKRALFLLLTYLKSIKYNEEVISAIINEWNEKQDEELKKNYLKAQLSWFKSKEGDIIPPNFNNDNYYKGIGIPEDIINQDINSFKEMKIKNPLQHTYLYLKRNKENKEEKEEK